MQKLLLRRRSAYASIFAITLAVLLIQSFSPSSQTSSFSLSLDLDGAVGGQAMHSLNVSPDQDVSIQIFGTDIQNASGLSVRIEYDATQVVYEGFDTGDVLPNVRVQKGDSTAVSRTPGQASFVQINLASLGGSATVNSGLVGTLRFLTTDAFLGTEIRLVRAELGRGEQSEAVPLSLSVGLRVAAVPDFDGSGTVDFPDFLFLVSVFGSRLNDGKYETKYDLDGNGEIAFDDFLIFVSSFGKSVDTIDQPYATKRVATSSDFLSVCDRTPQVRDAIVTALGATDCGSVTEQNLSNLTNRLEINGSSESSILALKVGDFSGLSELRRLSLINNSLTTLDNNVFVGMSKLKALEVSGSNISDIHAGAFGGLDSLSALSLEDNNITSLRDNTFKPLTKLRILWLNRNDITSVSSLPLDDLSKLSSLELKFNDIASLSSRDFADVSYLSSLYLQGNKLSALPDSLFYNMIILQTLDFRSNSVDPLNVRVSLEKIQNSDGTSDKFFVEVHTGAPFALNIPVTVSGGTLDVDNNVVTISGGSMSSSVVTATRIDATADNDITVTLGDVQIAGGGEWRGLAFEKVSNSITLSPEVVAVFVFEPSVTWGNEQVSFVSADAFGVEENSSNVGTVSARIYRRPSEFKDLGDITGLTSGKGYFESNESLGDNHEKYYRFVLTQPKVINIGLRQLDVDTDLILEDADGSVLHLGTSNDPSKRAIKVSLCEGTYYAHVKVKDFGENIFNFRYGIVPGSPDASEVSRLRGRSIGGAVSGYTVSGGSDGDKFSISESGLLMFNDVPNYENPLDVASTSPLNDAGNNEYVVVVTGSGESSSGTQSIVVTVSDKDDEVPGQVETPVVSEATMNSLKVMWTAPANMGPEITDYDVQYKASGESEFTDAEYDGTDLTTTLTGLKPGTSYEVQVRAKNDEGTGVWSDSGSGMTIENQAPVFTSAATFEVKENNTTVGTVSANDEDSDDSITGYAITGGSDQDQFEITEEGGLRFKAAPNYEVPADVESADPANVASNNEYIVEVTATGGKNERVLTAGQTITVTVSDKDDEAPGQPAVPTVAEATLTTLKVTWAVPANTGPEITDYDVQYKASGESEFTDAEYDGTDLTTTLTGLKPGTSYEVQVRATSDEGTGAWSESGSGMTIENQAPVFTSSATFEVKENNTTVGTVSANDEDSDDSITGYAITGGSDQDQFEITDEGGLRFKAAPNYEVPADVESADPANVASNNEYIVEVTATGGASERVLTAAQTITVTVSDKDDEAPGQVETPVVSEATLNSLKVTWAVPANTGPEITDYDVQYKASGESEFTDADYDGTDLTTTLTDLKPGTSYEVQVRAESDEGTGAWSDSGSGMTIENQAPVFTSNATFEVKENNTTVGAVSANDKDSDDSITGYAITGGSDQDQFEITDEGGLRFKAAPNYEVPADVESADPANVANNNEYIVEVTATGGASERVLTAAQTITVTVTDKDDEAPGQPAALTVAEATLNSMKVTWAVPANTGPEITDYDVQYKASDDDGFTDAEYDGTDLTTTLTGLKPGTSYEVQVRAKNDEGTGAWSELGSGMTIENQAPVFTSNATFEVKENNTTVGTVSANDEDSDDSITGYAITGGVDQDQFEITEEDGLRFKAAPNYEVPADVESADPANVASNNEYIVEVTATSGASERVLTAAQTITVTVSDKDDEAPGQVETPVVSEATMNSLKVTWAVPANTGPEIIDYDVQYKASDDDGFTDAEYDGTDLTMTLTGLAQNKTYQVRAKNDEGTGAWSDSGEGKMKVNVAPVFTSNATFNVLENVTGVGIVVANDADSDDSITSYAITGGADQTQFSIVSETGVLIFKAAPDFEAPLDANIDNAYIVEVTATSGENGRALTATQTITVIVTDIGPPEKLDAPTVTQATVTTLTITWENTSVVLNTDNVSIFNPIDVALDIAGNKMYWTDSGSIRRADLDGTNVEDLIRDAVQFPVGIALDIAGNKMYWVDLYSNKVQRADLNGENIEDLVTTGQGKPGGIALDIARNKMYWMDSGSIRRADLDGENVEDLITGLPDKFGGIALDIVGNKMYWAIGDRIRRADLDGENVEDLVTAGLEDPFGIALDIGGNKLYWADRGTDKIRRADLNGRNVEDHIATGLGDPFGIALDIVGNKMYWTETARKKIGRIDLDIINYDIQYRIIDTASFINANYTGEELTTTLTGLKSGTRYEVQVRATNAEGTGDWSEFLSVETKVLFFRTTFLVNENRVHAGFLGYDRNIRYSIVGGQDGHLFSIINASSMLRFKSAPDYERPLDAGGDNAYVIDIRVQESYGEISSQSQQQILVEVTDVNIPLAYPTVEISHQSALSSITVNGIAESLYLTDDEITCFVPHISNGNNFLYWGDAAGNIHRYSESVDQVVVSGLENPTSLALDPTSEKIYWADSAAGKIQRANLDGSNVEDIATFDPFEDEDPNRVSLALDLDNGKVYWTDVAQRQHPQRRALLIRRANLDGSSPEHFVRISSVVPPFAYSGAHWVNTHHLAVFDGRVYLRYGDTVIARGLNGGQQQVIRIPYMNGVPRSFHVGDLSVSNGKIYWAENTERRRVIRRANVDGSNVEDIVEVPGDPSGTTSGLIDKVFFDQTVDRLYWTICNAGGINFLDFGGDMDVRYRVSDGGNFVESNESSGVTEVISGLTPGETYDVQARISNIEGKGEWSPSIQVLINQPPEFSFESVQWTVRNHSSTSPDFEVSANDTDFLTYTIVGPDADYFIYENGRILLKPGLSFDRDVKRNYDFSLMATDGKGEFSMLSVEVFVSDISNNPPYYETGGQPLPVVLRLDNNVIAHPSRNNFFNVFRDSDGDNLRYSLRGQDAHKFAFDPETGNIVVPANINGNSGDIYTFEFHASDGHGGTAEVPVHVYNIESNSDITESFRRFLNWRAWNGAARRVEPSYSMVPDFSYAGYHYFEKPVPELSERTYPIFDVTDYGAIANDVYSDQPAIERAIAEAEAAGGGTIFFPEGEYLVATQTDLIDGDIQPIQIQGSNIVFKGVGADTNIRYSDREFWLVWSSDVPETIEWGSIIRQVYNPEADGDDSTPALFQFIPSDTTSQEITTIVERAQREDFWITVADASQLRVEQRVVLCMYESDWDDFIDDLTSRKSSSDWTSGLKVYERHQIAEIRENRVRFKEPLHFYLIEPEHGWSVRTYPHIEEVGVEDLSIQGTWRHKYKHHENAHHDSGYTPLAFEKCVNSWVRRVNFVNVNIGMLIYRCMAMSVYQVRLAGSRGHFFIKNKKNYGLFIGLTEDKGGSKYGTPNRKGQYHGSNVQSSTTGTVHWRNDMFGNQKIDPHASCPYANLYDRNNGGHISGGGNDKSLPNHLFHFVCWNHTHKRIAHRNYHFWSSDDGDDHILKPIFVGYHSVGGTFEMHYEDIDESPGTIVSPSSLFEAQLELRLGEFPRWFIAPWLEWNQRKQDIWVPPVLIKKSLKLGFENQEFDNGVKRLDLSDYFRKVYNITYSTYSATSYNPDIATVKIVDVDIRNGNDGDLILRRHRSGRVRIRVTARGSFLGYKDHVCPIPASQTFTLNID